MMVICGISHSCDEISIVRHSSMLVVSLYVFLECVHVSVSIWTGNHRPKKKDWWFVDGVVRLSIYDLDPWCCTEEFLTRRAHV